MHATVLCLSGGRGLENSRLPALTLARTHLASGEAQSGLARCTASLPCDIEVLEANELSLAFSALHVLDRLPSRVYRGEYLVNIGAQRQRQDRSCSRRSLGPIPFTTSVRWAPGTRIGYR